MFLPKSYQAKITKNLALTPRVHQIILELVEPKTIEFTAGQFLMFQVSEAVKRAYSIASTPQENAKVELFIDTAPGGPASQYFSQVKEGTACTFMAPYGQFMLRDTPHDKIFLAGSTGVAPIRSMILDYLAGPASRQLDSNLSAASKSLDKLGTDSSKIGQDWRLSPERLTLYFGVNKVEELFLVEEFQELEKKFSNFKYIPVVATPEREWDGETGLVSAPLLRELGPTASCKTGLRGINKDFYICGSPNMVHAVKQQLLDKGVNQENIFNEGF